MAARSSGEAESVGVDESVRSLLGIHNDHAAEIHGAARSLAAVGLPCISLAENMGLTITERRLLIDASTAIAAISKGFSRVMAYLPKTQGVNLAFLSETISRLGFKIAKVPSAANLADVHTKVVSRSVLEALLPGLGVVKAA